MRALFVVLPVLSLVFAVASPHDGHARAATTGAEARGGLERGTDPPELGGCNSRCRRVYCAESGSGRTYLCRCDCPK